MLRRESAAGLSLVEALFALSLTMTAAGVAVPALLEIDRGVKLRGAASFALGYLQRARLEALSRSATVGIRFRPVGDDWFLGTYLDANGNGVRSADVAAGVDPALDEEQAFSARASSVRVARLANVPDVNGDAGGAAVRFGASRIASFARDGSASSGSLYLTDGRTQLAVTVTAATGRVRLRQWDAGRAAWRQIR